MDIVIEPPKDDNTEASIHKFAKMMLGTAAGFIAKDCVENLYEALLKKHRDKNTPALPS